MREVLCKAPKRVRTRVGQKLLGMERVVCYSCHGVVVLGAMSLSRANQPSFNIYGTTRCMGNELALKCIRLNLVLMQLASASQHVKMVEDT